mgnify:CR=1 FL=1
MASSRVRVPLHGRGSPAESLWTVLYCCDFVGTVSEANRCRTGHAEPLEPFFCQPRLFELNYVEKMDVLNSGQVPDQPCDRV